MPNGLWPFHGGYTRQDYQNVTLTNGTVENQTQLNGNTYRIGPKFTYDFAPDLRPFVQSSYARFAFDDNAFSANEYSGVVGADFDLRQLVRGTAFAGYKTHSYDSSIMQFEDRGVQILKGSEIPHLRLRRHLVQMGG